MCERRTPASALDVRLANHRLTSGSVIQWVSQTQIICIDSTVVVSVLAEQNALTRTGNNKTQVCVYILIYIYQQVHVHGIKHIHVHGINSHLNTYTCTPTDSNTYKDVYTYAAFHIYTRMYMCNCRYMSMCTHICIYMFMYYHMGVDLNKYIDPRTHRQSHQHTYITSDGMHMCTHTYKYIHVYMIIQAPPTYTNI